MKARRISVLIDSGPVSQFNHSGGSTPTGLMSRFLIPAWFVLLLAGGCADVAAESSTTTSVATTLPPITTTTTSMTTTTAAPTTTTTVPRPAVTGSLALGFVPWQSDAQMPPAPRSVSFVLLSDGVEIRRELRDPGKDTEYLVDDEVITGELGEQPNWELAILYVDFGIALEAGEYELVALEVDDPEWSSNPVSLVTGRPRFSVTDTPCTYIGLLTFIFYRLPAGSIDEQQSMAGEVAASTGVEYFTLLETGSLFGESANLSVPSAEERPEDAADCAVQEAEWQQ